MLNPVLNICEKCGTFDRNRSSVRERFSRKLALRLLRQEQLPQEDRAFGARVLRKLKVSSVWDEDS